METLWALLECILKHSESSDYTADKQTPTQACGAGLAVIQREWDPCRANIYHLITSVMDTRGYCNLLISVASHSSLSAISPLSISFLLSSTLIPFLHLSISLCPVLPLSCPHFLYCLHTSLALFPSSLSYSLSPSLSL